MKLSNIFSKQSAVGAIDNQSFSMPASQNSAGTLSRFSRNNIVLIKRVALVVGLFVLLVVVVKILNIKVPGTGSVAGTAQEATAALSLSQSYTFDGRNDQAKVVDKHPIKMTFVSAELNRKILIKGQPATARDGKIFLVVNMDLENQSSDRMYLPVYDMIRLQEGDKLRAPDVHNSLVQIDPISSKGTRIGFLIDDKGRDFSLKIGELTGTKQTIDLKF